MWYFSWITSYRPVLSTLLAYGEEIFIKFFPSGLFRFLSFILNILSPNELLVFNLIYLSNLSKQPSYEYIFWYQTITYVLILVYYTYTLLFFSENKAIYLATK